MRKCLMSPGVTCTAKRASDTCVCVPPGFNPEEWREMEPHERKAMIDGAAEVLQQALEAFHPKSHPQEKP